MPPAALSGVAPLSYGIPSIRAPSRLPLLGAALRVASDAPTSYRQPVVFVHRSREPLALEVGGEVCSKHVTGSASPPSVCSAMLSGVVVEAALLTATLGTGAAAVLLHSAATRRRQNQGWTPNQNNCSCSCNCTSCRHFRRVETRLGRCCARDPVSLDASQEKRNSVSRGPQC
jgi:hypothetical protein